jgi:hypothetical protein
MRIRRIEMLEAKCQRLLNCKGKALMKEMTSILRRRYSPLECQAIAKAFQAFTKRQEITREERELIGLIGLDLDLDLRNRIARYAKIVSAFEGSQSVEELFEDLGIL